MFVRTICYPVTVLGPGKRLGIWLSGCSKRCLGCMSPELQERRESDEVSLDYLMSVLTAQAPDADGITISGGEPFEQGEDLFRLVKNLKKNISDDILVYTGWTLSEVLSDKWGARTVSMISTLIDGAYVADLDDGQGLRGSSNQVVHKLGPSPSYDYEQCERHVQGFVFDNKLFTVGLR